MDTHGDIYAGIIDFSHDQIEKMTAKCRSLVEENHRLQNALAEYRCKVSNMEKSQTVLKRNFDSLLQTAKAEVNRKNERLKEVQQLLQNRAARPSRAKIDKLFNRRGKYRHLKVKNSSNSPTSSAQTQVVASLQQEDVSFQFSNCSFSVVWDQVAARQHKTIPLTSPAAGDGDRSTGGGSRYRSPAGVHTPSPVARSCAGLPGDSRTTGLCHKRAACGSAAHLTYTVQHGNTTCGAYREPGRYPNQRSTVQICKATQTLDCVGQGCLCALHVNSKVLPTTSSLNELNSGDLSAHIQGGQTDCCCGSAQKGVSDNGLQTSLVTEGSVARDAGAISVAGCIENCSTISSSSNSGSLAVESDRQQKPSGVFDANQSERHSFVHDSSCKNTCNDSSLNRTEDRPTRPDNANEDSPVTCPSFVKSKGALEIPKDKNGVRRSRRQKFDRIVYDPSKLSQNQKSGNSKSFSTESPIDNLNEPVNISNNAECEPLDTDIIIEMDLHVEAGISSAGDRMNRSETVLDRVTSQLNSIEVEGVCASIDKLRTDVNEDATGETVGAIKRRNASSIEVSSDPSELVGNSSDRKGVIQDDGNNIFRTVPLVSLRRPEIGVSNKCVDSNATPLLPDGINAVQPAVSSCPEPSEKDVYDDTVCTEPSEKDVYHDTVCTEPSEKGVDVDTVCTERSEKGVYDDTVCTERSEKDVYVDTVCTERSEKDVYDDTVCTERSEKDVYVDTVCTERSEKGVYDDTVCTERSEKDVYDDTVCTERSEKDVYVDTVCTERSEKGVYDDTVCTERSEKDVYDDTVCTERSEKDVYDDTVCTERSEKDVYVDTVCTERSEKGVYDDTVCTERSEKDVYDDTVCTERSEKDVYVDTVCTERSEKDVYDDTVCTERSEKDVYVDTVCTERSEKDVYDDMVCTERSEKGVDVDTVCTERSEKDVYDDTVCTERSEKDVYDDTVCTERSEKDVYDDTVCTERSEKGVDVDTVCTTGTDEATMLVGCKQMYQVTSHVSTDIATDSQGKETMSQVGCFPLIEDTLNTTSAGRRDLDDSVKDIFADNNSNVFTHKNIAFEMTADSGLRPDRHVALVTDASQSIQLHPKPRDLESSSEEKGSDIELDACLDEVDYDSFGTIQKLVNVEDATTAECNRLHKNMPASLISGSPTPLTGAGCGRSEAIAELEDGEIIDDCSRNADHHRDSSPRRTSRAQLSRSFDRNRSSLSSPTRIRSRIAKKYKNHEDRRRQKSLRRSPSTSLLVSKRKRPSIDSNGRFGRPSLEKHEFSRRGEHRTRDDVHEGCRRVSRYRRVPILTTQRNEEKSRSKASGIAESRTTLRNRRRRSGYSPKSSIVFEKENCVSIHQKPDLFDTGTVQVQQGDMFDDNNTSDGKVLAGLSNNENAAPEGVKLRRYMASFLNDTPYHEDTNQATDRVTSSSKPEGRTDGKSTFSDLDACDWPGLTALEVSKEPFSWSQVLPLSKSRSPSFTGAARAALTCTSYTADENSTADFRSYHDKGSTLCPPDCYDNDGKVGEQADPESQLPSASTTSIIKLQSTSNGGIQQREVSAGFSDRKYCSQTTTPDLHVRQQTNVNGDRGDHLSPMDSSNHQSSSPGIALHRDMTDHKGDERVLNSSTPLSPGVDHQQLSISESSAIKSIPNVSVKRNLSSSSGSFIRRRKRLRLDTKEFAGASVHSSFNHL